MKYTVIKLLFVALAIFGFYLLMNPGFLYKSPSDGDYVSVEHDLSSYQSAVFAGGCFWCLEPAFEKLPGVVEVLAGYTGGDTPDPSYRDVVSGNTGHREAVIVYYHPEIISYDVLLDVFWMNIDPTDPGGQFADRGAHYQTAIFYNSEHQKELAKESKASLDASGRFDKPVVTDIMAASIFYPAELYHQDYYIKNADTFGVYRPNSPRARFTDQVWGEEKYRYDKTYSRPDDATIRESLTPLQYKVTQEDGTEPPFNNKYFDNVGAEGIYVDIVSGEPLFSSLDMFESGTGWPSFTKPLVPMHMIYKTDNSLMIPRIEVRSKFADSHLGHVFIEESELPCRRYCINSAALRFIPKEQLESEGYAEFIVLFNK